MTTLKRSEQTWVDDFMTRAAPENIRDLLIQINDHLASRGTWLNDAPLCDLSDIITDVEDAIWEHNTDALREIEAREDWAEAREDARREETENV